MHARRNTDRPSSIRPVLSRDKLELLGELSKNCAHEINNVFAAITGFASVLQHELDPGSPLLRDVRGIEQAALRGVEITRNMMSFGGSETRGGQTISLNETIQLVRSLLMRSISPDIDVELRLDERVGALNANPIQLKQAFVNLGINAAEAMRGPGKITISTESVELDADIARGRPAGSYARIRVSDTGCGMDADVLEQCVEPFFTTKPSRVGLGLALTTATVEQHGGSIEVFSRVGLGTTVTVYLPQHSAERPDSGRPTISGKDDGQRGVVMVIDDDAPMLSAAKRLLETLHVEVIGARSGAIGVQEYKKRMPEVDLVLLDLIMPERDGIEVLGDLKALDPNAAVVIASGYPLQQIDKNANELGVMGVIEKPYTRKQLEALVEQAIGRRRQR